MLFLLPSIKCSAAKLEARGVAEHLTNGSEKLICWSSFEFYSLQAIERRRKILFTGHDGLWPKGYRF